MWLKVAVLLLYLVLIFVLSRILEANLYWESGLFSTSILDPFTLSVRQLKSILESRGVSYVGAIEKQDLTSLVSSYGHVTQSDLTESVKEADDTSLMTEFSSTNFTCEKHFYEEVEDSKDSVWLIQVVPSRGSPLLNDFNWKHVIKKVMPFGIWTGVIHCDSHPRLCQHKMWNKPLIILALPRGNKAKDTVVFRSLTTAAKSEAIITWVKEQLASRLKVILSDEEFLNFSNDSSSSVVRVLFVSHTKDPPLFYSALSAKFAGRVTFAMSNAEVLKNRINGTSTSSTAAYYVITPEGMFQYGFSHGQNLNYKSMGFFLRTLQPEANDTFVLSLIVINIMVCLDFFILRSKFWKHLVKSIWQLVKYNFALLLVWLALSGLCRFAFMELLTKYCLQVVRTLSLNHNIGMMLVDLKVWNSCSFGLCGTVLLMCLTYAWIKRMLFPNVLPSDTMPLVLDLDFGEEMELLIGHLATPNIWLQPRFQNRDYINDLPVWRFNGNDVDTAEKNQPVMETPRVTRDLDSGSEYNSQDEVLDYDHLIERSLNLTLHLEALRLNNDFLSTVLNGGRRSSVSPSNRGVQTRNEVDQLPVGAIVTFDCAICLEHYQDGDRVCGLPCGHNYHHLCILNWLLRDHHHCPTCRRPSYRSRGFQPAMLD